MRFDDFRFAHYTGNGCDRFGEALKGIMRDEGTLHWTQPSTHTKPLDGCHLTAFAGNSQHHT
jgi:hypothetical protein